MGKAREVFYFAMSEPPHVDLLESDEELPRTRKRTRPQRYGEEFGPKKQCVISFLPVKPTNGSKENKKPKPGQPVAKKRARGSRKTKSSIPPLSFLVETPVKEVKKAPAVSDVSKLFNNVIQTKATANESTKLHPFFAKVACTRVHTSPRVQKTATPSVAAHFDVLDALPPIHIQQISDKEPLHIEFSLLHISQQGYEPEEDLEFEAEKFSLDNVNLVAPYTTTTIGTIHTQQTVHSKGDEHLPGIPVKVYLPQLKTIQDQLLRRYPLGCSHMFLTDQKLLSVFQESYISRSSEVEGRKDLLWTERFKPLSAADYFSNSLAGNQLYAWLYSWKQLTSDTADNQSAEMNEAQQELRSYKAFLLHSVQPIGKSSLVYCLARQMVGVLALSVTFSYFNRK